MSEIKKKKKKGQLLSDYWSTKTTTVGLVGNRRETEIIENIYGFWDCTAISINSSFRNICKVQPLIYCWRGLSSLLVCRVQWQQNEQAAIPPPPQLSCCQRLNVSWQELLPLYANLWLIVQTLFSRHKESKVSRVGFHIFSSWTVFWNKSTVLTSTSAVKMSCKNQNNPRCNSAHAGLLTWFSSTLDSFILPQQTLQVEIVTVQ